MAENTSPENDSRVGWWQPMLFAALACGMGWGIRGQYGHETGAMNAGVMTCLVLAYLLAGHLKTLTLVRAIAMGTVGVGIGGSMTYGQTVGLLHDTPLVGNWEAARWGMLGLAIKGSIWIGFCGAFFGMGLSGRKYGSLEILALMLGTIGLAVIGYWLLNTPFDPENQKLPSLYFSDNYYFEPEDADPRPEVWGGWLFALLTVILACQFWFKDTLGRNMGLWGMLGGAIGFPAGQSIQAYHAWNRDDFKQGIWENLAPYMNWWNWMETTFGLIAGATLGLGLWLNRRKIGGLFAGETKTSMPIPIEIVLLIVHCILLFFVEFRAVRAVDMFYDHGLILALIPLVCIVGGRLWPYMVIFPITLMPIAGKTLRQLHYREESIGLVPGWALYVVIPLLISTIAALYFWNRHRTSDTDRNFAGVGLMITGWTFFLLNWAFFHAPWPWEEWTGRTPNGLFFTMCIFGLTGLVAARFLRGRAPEEP